MSRFEHNNTRLHIEVIVGRGIADSLAEYAMKNEVDLIVISSHGGSGTSHPELGSVADRVLRVASVPVLMVRSPVFIFGS